MRRRKASAPRRRPVTPAAISVADPLANHATGALADDTRLSSHSLAQPLSPMAHGNLLGLPRGRDRLRRFLAVCVAAAGGFVAVFAVGRTRWEPAAPPTPQRSLSIFPDAYFRALRWRRMSSAGKIQAACGAHHAMPRQKAALDGIMAVRLHRGAANHGRSRLSGGSWAPLRGRGGRLKVAARIARPTKVTLTREAARAGAIWPRHQSTKN